MSDESMKGGQSGKRFKDTYIPRLMPLGAAIILLMILLPLLREGRRSGGELARVAPPLALKVYATGETGVDSLLNDGLRAFGRGEHGEAARLLSMAHFFWTVKIREGERERYPEDMRFYLALAHLYRGSPERGIPYLEDEREGDPHEEKYPWYLAHLFLAAGRDTGAREMLERVVALEGSFAAEARRKLERLPPAADSSR